MLKVLLRDFESSGLVEQAGQLRKIAAEVEREIPGVTVSIDVRRQYRNMRDGLEREPRAVDFAARAHALMVLPDATVSAHEAIVEVHVLGRPS